MSETIQFDFAKHWSDTIRRIRNRPSVLSAFDEIRDFYLETARLKFEDSVNENPIQADADYKISILKATLSRFTLHWLRDNFDGISLSPLVLAIAQELFPEKNWEILDDNNGQAIVTDREATIVLDIKYFDVLNAHESLSPFRARSVLTDLGGPDIEVR